MSDLPVGTSSVQYPLALRLLDHQVDGPDGGALAKVDDIEIELRTEGPFATALLCGPGALGPRLPGRVGSWTTAVWRRLSLSANPSPLRIPLLEVRDITAVVTVTAEAAEAVRQQLSLERWLGEHLIERLPGSGAEPLPAPETRTRRAVDLHEEQPDVPVLRLSEVLLMEAEVDNRQLGTIHEVVARRDNPSAPVVGAMPVHSYIVGGRDTGSTLGYDRHPEHGPWILRAAMLAWHRRDVEITQRDVLEFDRWQRRITARAASAANS